MIFPYFCKHYISSLQYIILPLMKQFVLSAALALTLLMVQPLYAGGIVTDQPQTQLHYMQKSISGVAFRSTVGSLQFREIETNQGTFTELYIPDHLHSARIGEPNLPNRCRLLEVPVNNGFRVEIIRSEYTDYFLPELGIHHPLMPVQPSLSKGIDNPEEVPFAISHNAYLVNDFNQQPLVTLTPAGTLRNLNLAHLVIAPVQYNPVAKTIRVYTIIEASVTFLQPDAALTHQQRQKYHSIYFNRIDKLTDSFRDSPDTLITTGPVTYVIVSPPEFRDALQPLVKWKTRKGFRVIEGYTDEPGVGTTTGSIKGYLQDLYQNPPAGFDPPSFILFVGDVAQIPAWNNNGQPTDLRYCEYTGDNLPEVFYGRFSAANLTQLQPYIDKTLEYEQYLFPDESYLNEDVMVAGYDAGGNGLTYGNGQVNYGTSYYFNTAHNLTSHNYLQPEPSGANYSQQIRDNVSSGVCYANYTAHCSESGWADPEFSINHIAALQNAGKYCLMVGNCCLSSRFNTNCFAEEVTRAPGKGAVGYIGASNNSYWNEDFWWGCGLKAVTTNPVYDPLHLGAYDVTFHDHGEATTEWFTTMGQMFVGGNMAVEQSNSSMKEYYWEIYNLMGDPSLSIYYSVPQPVSATLPQVLLVGTNTCTITAEPWAYVALSLNDSTLLDAGCTDSTGQVTLQYSTLTTPQYAQFVITKQNRKPMIDSVMIIQPSGPYITLGTVSINDSLTGNNNHKADYDEIVSLRMVVNNVGMASTSNLIATLATADTNVTVLNPTTVLGSIPANSTVTGSAAFLIRVKNNVTDQVKVPFTIQFADSSSWSGSYQMTLNAPVISIGNITVLDPLPGGNNNGVFDPGETVQLKVRIANSGHSPVTNTHALMNVLPGSAGYILLNNSTSFVGMIPVNGNGFAWFNAVSNGITPPGTNVLLNLLVRAGQYNQYDVAGELSVGIGIPVQYIMSTTTFSACNGVFLDPGGVSGNYGNNQDFVTTIHAGSPGAKLRAIFTEFNVEPNPNCGYDYLSVFNGPSMMDPLVGTFCGTDLPDTITSTSNVGSLTFLFHSDWQHTFPGWAATLKCMGGPMSVIANSFPSRICEGGSSQLTAVVNGGSGNYTYQWSPALYLDDPFSPAPIATPEANITYTVTISDGTNAITSEPIAMEVVTAPEPPIISLNGNTLSTVQTTGIQWYINGNLIPGATSGNYTPTSSGDYTATITDTVTGCESGHSGFITWLVTGTGTLTAQDLNRVYPNPARERLTIVTSSANNPTDIIISDAAGKTCLMKEFSAITGNNARTMEVDISSLAPGLYLCTIQNQHTRSVHKIMITK